jgi:hypothetical protein
MELATKAHLNKPVKKDWTTIPAHASELKDYMQGERLFKVKRKGKAANDMKYIILPQK